MDEQQQIAITPEQFAAAVTQATEQSTQNVAAIHRRRLVNQATWRAAIAAGVAACVIAIPTTYFLTKAATEESRNTAHANTLRNCEAQAQARPQSNARAFDQIEFFALLEDAFHPERILKHPEGRTPSQRSASRDFVAAELRRINRDLPHWRPYAARSGGNELPPKVTGFGQLAGTIRPVPLLDCHGLVKG